MLLFEVLVSINGTTNLILIWSSRKGKNIIQQLPTS